MVKRYRMVLDYDGNGESFPGVEESADGEWVEAKDLDALAAENAALRARLAEAEREQDTLLAMIRHQQDVLRECLPYVNESMAGRRPGRSADDIRAAVKALTTDSASVEGEK